MLMLWQGNFFEPVFGRFCGLPRALRNNDVYNDAIVWGQRRHCRRAFLPPRVHFCPFSPEMAKIFNFNTQLGRTTVDQSVVAEVEERADSVALKGTVFQVFEDGSQVFEDGSSDFAYCTSPPLLGIISATNCQPKICPKWRFP
jgi:hypothetical protein